MSYPLTTRGLYALHLKSLFDLIGAVTAIIIFSPLLLLSSALVRFSSSGPVLFRQERLGRGATTFQAFKFRTMINKPRSPDTEYFKGDPGEITIVGRWLRRLKIDELPQLLNVLRGEMSLVGPRPQLPVQLSEFDENAKLRLLVRPGLTGMAQVNGNTALTWPERWYYDAYYVRNLSFSLDVRIILRTVLILLLGEERFVRRPDGLSD